MRIRCIPLTAIALLAACSHNGVSATTSTASTSSTSIGTAVAAPPPTRGPEAAKWIDLDVGDCLADPPPTDPSVVMVTIVDCAGPHAAEVFLRTAVEVNEAVAEVADRGCAHGLPEYTGRPANDSQFVLSYLIDSNQDRTSNNPMPSTVICVLQAANGGTLTGSAHP